MNESGCAVVGENELSGLIHFRKIKVRINRINLIYVGPVVFHMALSAPGAFSWDHEFLNSPLVF